MNIPPRAASLSSSMAPKQSINMPSKSELKRLAFQRPLMEHGPDCWKWGAHHYECAKKKIEELIKPPYINTQWEKIEDEV